MFEASTRGLPPPDRAGLICSVLFAIKVVEPAKGKTKRVGCIIVGLVHFNKKTSSFAVKTFFIFCYLSKYVCVRIRMCVCCVRECALTQAELFLNFFLGIVAAITFSTNLLNEIGYDPFEQHVFLRCIA